jgi:hypothetical protein
MMGGFDMVSLLTRVPIREAMNVLGQHFEEEILRLFRHVLTSSYPHFSFSGQFYEQSDGVATGSPLSPVIHNFFMENFEEMALNRATHKPLFFCHLATRPREAEEIP